MFLSTCWTTDVKNVNRSCLSFGSKCFIVGDINVRWCQQWKNILSSASVSSCCFQYSNFFPESFLPSCTLRIWQKHGTRVPDFPKRSLWQRVIAIFYFNYFQSSFLLPLHIWSRKKSQDPEPSINEFSLEQLRLKTAKQKRACGSKFPSTAPFSI